MNTEFKLALQAAGAHLFDARLRPLAFQESDARAAAAPAVAALRQLLVLRAIATGAQAIAIGVAAGLGVALPLPSMMLVVGALVAMNALTWLRLRGGSPVQTREVAAQLAVDLAAFTSLLVLSGGTDNPFAPIFLLHMVLIALLLPRAEAIAGGVFLLACFGLAFHFSSPLRLADGGPLSAPLIATGQWASFILTASVIGWFVSRAVGLLHARDLLLRETAQQAQNDNAVMRIGALAAGAAHELATPLTTMAVVVGEMKPDSPRSEIERDIGILSAQISACRQTLRDLISAAGHARASHDERVRIDHFLDALAGRCRALRPGVGLTCRSEGGLPVPEIRADQALRNAILILLDNAADASPDSVDMHCRWDDRSVVLTIADRGPGLPEGSFGKLGTTFFTTKPRGKGNGLGLVLAARSVAQLGGTIAWSNRPERGASAEVTLSLGMLESTTRGNPWT